MATKNSKTQLRYKVTLKFEINKTVASRVTREKQ